METGRIFISHATKDDGFVRELRVKLEAHGLPVWVDSRNLRGAINSNRRSSRRLPERGR
jgi:hypothetical protein